MQVLPAVAVLRSQMATPELSPKRRLSTITKKDAKGKEVPKDVLRRKEAEAADPNNGVDRPLQLACIAAIVVPLAWAGATQEAPTAGERCGSWKRLTGRTPASSPTCGCTASGRS